ncbi:MAG: conserved membrane protein of unknown function [Candidatus Thorarchaeota archaeon]|nr:MAG: conserved membrane protein of unknown function [Candidatus Thorarchaeota archaeon]
MANIWILGTIKFIHDLCTAIWIGGLIVMGAVLLPSIRDVIGMNEQTKKLTSRIKIRLSKVVYLCMIGLFITGVLLSNRSPLFMGYFSISNEYSLFLTLKHILIAGMVLISLVRSQLIDRIRQIEQSKKNKLNILLIIINIILGILVLFLSGLTAAAGLMSNTP